MSLDIAKIPRVRGIFAGSIFATLTALNRSDARFAEALRAFCKDVVAAQ